MRWLTLEAWRKKPAKRKRAKKGRRWRPGKRSAIGFAAAVALTGIAGLGVSGWFGRQVERAVQGAYAMTAEAGLAVQDVLVVGRARTDRDEILGALGVERGAPILAFDPHAAKARLEKLPWVRQVIVERRLPGLLFVELQEREPMAIWQLKGKLAVIDREGNVIAGAKVSRFAELPLVVGEDAPEHAADLLHIIESEPDLFGLVKAAIRVGGRRWNLRLRGGIDVALPEADSAAAWAQLAGIERSQGLLKRDVSMIDLRLPDRLIVRTSPDVTPRRRPSELGEDT